MMKMVEEGNIKEDEKMILLVFRRSWILFRHNHDSQFSKPILVSSRIYLDFLLILIFSFISELDLWMQLECDLLLHTNNHDIMNTSITPLSSSIKSNSILFAPLLSHRFGRSMCTEHEQGVLMRSQCRKVGISLSIFSFWQFASN